MQGVTAARPAPPPHAAPSPQLNEVKAEMIETKMEPEDDRMTDVPRPALRASIDSDNRSSDEEERRTRKRAASAGTQRTPDTKKPMRLQCNICRLRFDTARTLDLHRFTVHGEEARSGFDDLTFVDFSSRKFPEIARGVCERSPHVSVTEPRYRCERCSRDFPCGRALDMHRTACAAPARPASPLRDRREDFFAKLDLRNSAFAGTMTPPSDRFSGKHYDDSYSEDGSHRPMEGVRDLADIQSIINVTAAGSLLERLTGTRVSLESAVLTPPDTGGKDREPEEKQDRFAAEFRRMKLRGEFPCRLCPAKFPNLRALKGHNRVHLSGTGPGPYRCNMCPHASLDKAALVRHMRTHNGDRPYECAVCNYAFTTKANCERHLRNRHAKVTREDVKRSIIYHPSEDPNNDEVNAKLGRDEVKRSLAFHTPEPERRDEATGRDTPLSHFSPFVAEPRRQILPTVLPDTPSTTPVDNQPLPRIKVKGIGQLRQIPEFQEPEKLHDEEDDVESVEEAPVDLSTSDVNDCDVLDLSKKKRDYDEETPPPPIARPPPFDAGQAAARAANFEKLQQIFLAHRQLFENSLPKIDSGFYATQLSQLYPGVPGLPGLAMPPSFPVNPYFLQPFFPPADDPPEFAEHKDWLQKKILRGLRLSGGSLVTSESENSQPRIEIVEEDKKPLHLDSITSPAPPVRPESPRPRREPIIPQTDSVKMVIKNGVLMPKQKQRRYRTERPFSCSQCSARFTLRSNMERHVKQQHPQHWSVRRPSPRAPPPYPAVDHMAERMKFALLASQLERPVTGPVLNDRSPVRRDSDEVADNEEDEDDTLVIDEEESELEPRELTAAHRAAAEILMATHQQELAKDFDLKIAGNLISKPQIASSEVSEPTESSEPIDEDVEVVAPAEPVVPVTVPAVPATNYEEEDEEGLVASTSEGNNSGSDENRSETDPAQPPKKKSAYSLAPNRVSCSYCHRKFPWSSSLRRHILTHTGQKPFKCPHCPLLFTTKSNCDRHLLRKHGASSRPTIVESSPPHEIPAPTPVQQNSEAFALRNVPERPYKCASCPSSTFSTLDNLKKHMSSRHGAPESRPATPSPEEEVEKPLEVADTNESALAFKCHLCEMSFGDRSGALRHLAESHTTEYEQLVSKGALDAASDRSESADDDDRGKFPDHANRKVVCAFCVRRFWSAEDLRRHMRTHSGERPFACDLCRRRFTLKHSMLRHRKKHRDQPSDEDEPVTPENHVAHNGYSFTVDDDYGGEIPANVNNNNSPPSGPFDKKLKIDSIRKRSSEDCEPENGNDLIGKLLGITDKNIISKLLSSADEAAKLLGVNK